MGEVRAAPEALRMDLAKESPFEIGGMRVIPSELSLQIGNRQCKLQPRIMRVLVALAKVAPTVLSRDRLIEECWDGRIVGDDAINRCIFALRHFADEFDPAPFTIETVPRVGHRLVEYKRNGDALRRGAPRVPKHWSAAAAAATLITVAAGMLFAGAVSLPWTPPRVPTVVIVPAAGDEPSQRLARDLAIQIGTLEQAEPAAMRLIGTVQRSPEKGDLILQVARTAEAARAAANVAIMAHGNILWSKEFGEAPTDGSNLKQQIAFSVARVLRCAVDAIADSNGPTDQDLKTYLDACAALADSGTDTENIVSMLRRVVARRPRFVSGWAKLLQAETQEDFGSDDPQRNRTRSALQRDIAASRRQQPYLAEAYIAESALRPASDFVGRSRILDAAVAHNPEHAGALVERSMFLQSVGRINDAVGDARRAVKLDPLSPEARDIYVTTLAMANRMEAARAELAQAERIWPGTATVVMSRYRFDLRFGDPREAQTLLRSGAIETAGVDIQDAFLTARITPTPENVARAISLGKLRSTFYPDSIDGHLQTLAQFGHKEELLDILLNWKRMDLVQLIDGVLFRPAFSNLHRDPRFMKVAKHLGLLSYWRTTGKWPDFCWSPDLPYDCKIAAASV